MEVKDWMTSIGAGAILASVMNVAAGWARARRERMLASTDRLSEMEIRIQAELPENYRKLVTTLMEERAAWTKEQARLWAEINSVRAENSVLRQELERAKIEIVHLQEQLNSHIAEDVTAQLQGEPG